MQSGSIGKQDNWARFMQLSNDARLRNQGLGYGVRKTNPLRKPAVTHPTAQAVTSNAGTIRSNALYTAAKPQISARILGGKFDAYA